MCQHPACSVNAISCGVLAPRVGYRMRAILVHSIFRKVLSLTPSARSRFSSGFIFNLVTQVGRALSAFCLPGPLEGLSALLHSTAR